MTESRGALEHSETESETRKLEGLCLSQRKARSGHEKETWVEIQKLVSGAEKWGQRLSPKALC